MAKFPSASRQLPLVPEQYPDSPIILVKIHPKKYADMYACPLLAGKYAWTWPLALDIRGRCHGSYL